MLIALVSRDYKFLVYIGAQDRHSDGGIFKNSEIGHRISEGLMDLPPPSLIDPAHTHPLPFVLVADEAFQLNYEAISRAEYHSRRANIQL